MLSPPSPGSCLFNEEPSDVPDNSVGRLSNGCLRSTREELPFTDVMQKRTPEGNLRRFGLDRGGNQPERARAPDGKPDLKGPARCTRRERRWRRACQLLLLSWYKGWSHSSTNICPCPYIYTIHLCPPAPPAPPSSQSRCCLHSQMLGDNLWLAATSLQEVDGIRSGATPSIRP